MSIQTFVPARGSLYAFALTLGFLLIGAQPARAHCDGVDGPVVKAARQALDAGNVNRVLIWVQADNESELRQAFARTLAVGKLNPEAKGLAETYFFETVVRLHRAGEGEPYTGLKPAGRDLGPAIPAADRAIRDGSDEALVKMLAEAAAQGVRERYRKVAASRDFPQSDLSAGRENVKAYVEFLHYVEGLHQAIQRGGQEHSH